MAKVTERHLRALLKTLPGCFPVPLEKDIQRNVIAYLELLGAVAVRVNSGMVKAPSGRPVRFNHTKAGSCSDVVFCLRGRFGAFEVKRPGGKGATKGQSKFLDAVIRAGGIGAIVRSVADAQAVIAAEWDSL